jgi:hypothetical protein
METRRKHLRTIGGKGTDIMLRKPHIRRPISALLMIMGAAMMYLALETWAGALAFALGVLIEVVGIAVKRKE